MAGHDARLGGPALGQIVQKELAVTDDRVGPLPPLLHPARLGDLRIKVTMFLWARGAGRNRSGQREVAVAGPGDFLEAAAVRWCPPSCCTASPGRRQSCVWAQDDSGSAGEGLCPRQKVTQGTVPTAQRMGVFTADVEHRGMLGRAQRLQMALGFETLSASAQEVGTRGPG